MEDVEPEEKKLDKRHKILAKNSLFSYIIIYGNYFSSIINSFLIARLISQSEWGFLITSLSMISLISLTFILFPPSLSDSLNYYIPKYRVLGETKKLKSFIKNSFLIRMGFLIPIFIILMVLIEFFEGLFAVNLQSYTYLLKILTPIIFINGIESMLNSIHRGFNRFNFVLLLATLKNVIYIGGLFYISLFIELIKVDLIAFIYLYSILIPFLMNCLISCYFYLKIKDKGKSNLSIGKTFKKITKYGSHITAKNYITSFNSEIYTQAVKAFENASLVTGYNIALHYHQIPSRATVALNNPLIVTFSELFSKKKSKQAGKIFKKALEASSFTLIFITGILFFLTEFFLSFVYGQSYLEFTLLVKLYLLTTVFNVITPLFFTLIRASENVKYTTPSILFIIAVKYPFFFIPLIFFNIYYAMIGMIISLALILVIFIYLTKKYFNIQLEYLKLFKLYSIFFLTVIGISLLKIIILNDLSSTFFIIIGWRFMKSFDFLSITLFILIFFSLISFNKIIKKEDISYLQALFEKRKKSHKYIRKILSLVKKFLRN